MTSLSKKPSTLPVSMTTTTNPNMPTFYNSGSAMSKAPKKKKSFSPFDKIKNVFMSRSRKLSESDESPRGLGPVIVTPTEESRKSIEEAEATSHSAENICGRNDEVELVSPRAALMPIGAPKAVSSECLLVKSGRPTKMLRSTECLVTKEVNFELPKRSTEGEKRVEEAIGDDGSSKENKCIPDAAVKLPAEHLRENENASRPAEMDLNGVQRKSDNLDHQAARHRQELKPKGRRPPTGYRQFVDQSSRPSSGSGNDKVSSPDVVLIDSIDVPREPVKVAPLLANKPSMLQHLKRNKPFVPHLDEIQKIRRQTISNFQMSEVPREVGDSGSVEEGGGAKAADSDRKIGLPRSQRNASFKFNRKEGKKAIVEKESEAPKVDLKPTLAVSQLEFKEKVPEFDLALRKSCLFQQKLEGFKSAASSAADQNKASFHPKPETTEKEAPLAKRPQSRFIMQGSVPSFQSGSFKLPKVEDQKGKTVPEATTNETKASSNEAATDSLPLSKPDKLLPPKKPSEEKGLANGHPEKSSDPPLFKKILKPTDRTLSNSEVPSVEKPSITTIKNPSKVEVSPAEEEPLAKVTEAFESARQRFELRSFKVAKGKASIEPSNVTSDVKAALVQPVQPPKFNAPSQAAPKTPVEDKSPPVKDPQSPVGISMQKKNESRYTVCTKQIPPEPFKSGLAEAGKTSAIASNVPQEAPAIAQVFPKPGASMKPKVVAKENVLHHQQQQQQQQGLGEDPQEQNFFRIPSMKKVSKENVPSSVSPREASGGSAGVRDQSGEKEKLALMRAASGTNARAVPSKLKFNPDDWMAKRRENLENSS